VNQRYWEERKERGKRSAKSEGNTKVLQLQKETADSLRGGRESLPGDGKRGEVKKSGTGRKKRKMTKEGNTETRRISLGG